MKGIITLFLTLSMSVIFSQNSYLIGNLQVNNLLDKTSFPTEIGFQFHTKTSIGAQIPLFYDLEKEKELFSLEIGIGTYMTSMYFKNSIRTNPRSQGKGGVISGFFFKAEPIFNLYQNKKGNFFLHASLNNVLHALPESESISGFTRKDSTEIDVIISNQNNAIQYSIEPSLGVSYLWKFKKSSNGILFRVKRGLVYHNQSITVLRISDTNETANIKLNNNNWTFSLAYLLKSKK